MHILFASDEHALRKQRNLQTNYILTPFVIWLVVFTSLHIDVYILLIMCYKKINAVFLF